MTNFAMQYSVLPDGLCTNLESAMQKFWWGFTLRAKKIHWIAWRKLDEVREVRGRALKTYVPSIW